MNMTGRELDFWERAFLVAMRGSANPAMSADAAMASVKQRRLVAAPEGQPHNGMPCQKCGKPVALDDAWSVHNRTFCGSTCASAFSADHHVTPPDEHDRYPGRRVR